MDISARTYEKGFVIWACSDSAEDAVAEAKKWISDEGFSSDDVALQRWQSGSLNVVLKRDHIFNQREDTAMIQGSLSIQSEENKVDNRRRWPEGTILWVARDEEKSIAEARAWVSEKQLTGEDVKMVKHKGMRIEIIAKREVLA